MKAETENYLTELGLWNNIPNVKISREKLAEMLEEFNKLQLRKAIVNGMLPKIKNEFVARREAHLESANYREEFTETKWASVETASLIDLLYKTVEEILGNYH